MAQTTNRRALRWLRGELPALVSSGTITAENSAAIERYYEGAEARRTNFGFVILASVGAALVGAGIVLLIAHNWDELSRATRTIIAFLPLLTAQALMAFVLLRRNESRAWRELVAIFDVAAVATAISLVSQTYQIQGTFAEFLRTWLLLSLPIVYLLRTTLGAVAYVIGAIVWLMHRGGFFGGSNSPNFFWVLLLLLVPYFLLRYRRGRDTRETATLAVVLAIAAIFGVGSTTEFARADIGGIAFAGLLTAIYLAGMKFFAQPNGRLHPLAFIGGIGLGITALVLSFEGMWHMSRSVSWGERTFDGSVALLIELFFPVAAVCLAAWDIVRRRAQFSIPAAALPISAAIAWVIANSCGPLNDRWQSTRCSFEAAAVINVYALWLGIDILARGIRVSSVARANFGLLLIAGLALCRFFDSDLSFVTRGVGFIAV
ncbi:MAG: hypothetical protein QOG48_1927, partial [Verrucomicrobiota bacterium]